MKVRQLIETLKKLPDQRADVYFAYVYGEHWRVTVAAEVAEVEEARVTWSPPHDMMRLAVDDDFDEHGNGAVEDVVVLSVEGVNFDG